MSLDRRSLSFLGLLIAFSVLPDLAAADQVKLKDGTVIVGTIRIMEDGLLAISNSAAAGGVVKIRFSEVESIASDGDHVILLRDGTRLRGKPMTDTAGQLAVQTLDAGAVTVDPAAIRAINPQPEKHVSHEGNVALNGRVTDGNTRTKSVGSTAYYVGRFEESRLTIKTDWNYEETASAISARNASGSMKYDYFFTKRLFAYTNSLFEGDDLANLNLRSTIGAGSGFQFVDSKEDGKPYSYYEEMGLSFVDEDFDGSKDERYTAARVAGRLEWALGNGVNFFHDHEIYFGLEDKDDVYAETKTGIRSTLVGNLFATIQMNYKWDNTPAPGSRRGDTEYLFGLGWSFDY